MGSAGTDWRLFDDRRAATTRARRTARGSRPTRGEWGTVWRATDRGTPHREWRAPHRRPGRLRAERSPWSRWRRGLPEQRPSWAAAAANGLRSRQRGRPRIRPLRRSPARVPPETAAAARQRSGSAARFRRPAPPGGRSAPLARRTAGGPTADATRLRIPAAVPSGPPATRGRPAAGVPAAPALRPVLAGPAGQTIRAQTLRRGPRP